MRVAVYTLGCKVNQFESAAIAEDFRAAGAEIVSYREEADIYIVNTCAVTSRAAYQSRQKLRSIRRARKDARIVATGCHVQTESQEILDSVPGQLCLIGNDQKARLPELAMREDDCLEFYVGNIGSVKTIAPFRVTHTMDRTRAYLRIQDGCSSFCSYCIVPFARGRTRSVPPGEVLDQVRIMADTGVREIVVSGIHVGQYGADLPDGPPLLILLERLCSAFPDIRFRLSSIEPTEVTEDMISWAAATPNFCPHWHIPLQSGSNTVLSRMNRHYSASFYGKLITSVRAAMPHAAIGTDVLAGFPGEDEKAFRETVDLLTGLPVTYCHVFPYSSRPGTMASFMPNRVSKKEKTGRIKVIQKLGEKKKQAFFHNQKGTVHRCLVEQIDRNTGMWRGHSANYIPVLLKDSPTTENFRNRLVTVKITEVRQGHVLGKVL
ncbi:MAG TPA: tRNA (N(6)-L-threonylcarbamoyladenosine(37)-C(2))-methylthiotransferase MtaB [Thermodesulfobacteriaceae bacterium]|nr:tRNA (N(6)-L-threonylcarbamoyladenosine(37)-C(2))-methylthiotransferase MtaB [Thermodesulfobacteriaceae bacterium]